MAHIESTERQIAKPNEAPHHHPVQFEGYAAHPGAQVGKHHIVHHGKELHMGNAYESAKPDPSSHCFGPCEKAKHWHPKEHDQSERAKEWRKNFSKEDHEKLKTDKDNHYEVKSGDAMGSIARRALEGHGHAKPTHEQVAKMEKEIIAASKKDNPTLECNPELIKPGMKLTVPPEKAQGQAKPENGVTGNSPYGSLPDKSVFEPKQPQTPYIQFPMSINPSYISAEHALNDHAAIDHSAVKMSLNPHQTQSH